MAGTGIPFVCGEGGVKKGCFTVLVCITLPVAPLAVFQGEPIYRNLNGLCSETGKRLSDREFILSALLEIKQSSKRSYLFMNKTTDQNLILDRYPNCCSVRRGYDERRLREEGYIAEMGSLMVWDRLSGDGYVRVRLDPRHIPIQDPLFGQMINPVDVYLDTCGYNGNDDNSVKRQMGDDG